MVYHVGVYLKLPVLLNLLAREQPTRALVFVNTRRGVHFVAERLERHGYRVGVLVGDVDQKKRIRMLREFKEKVIDILVATDVASRGLHIEAVSHVFNYDLPQDPEDYVHRIGRTARAGASGKALSLACEHHVYSLEAIEEFISMAVPHTFPEADLVRMPRPLPRAGSRADDRGDAGHRAERGSRGHAGRRTERAERGEGARVGVGARDGEVERDGDGTREDAADSLAASQETPEDASTSGDGTAPRRRRRRRRRRGSGEAAASPGADVDAG
jgi:ATP-dependent RNA helicase RhlB